MRISFAVALATLMLPVAAQARDAAAPSSPPAAVSAAARAPRLPVLLDDAARLNYRKVFAAIRAERWADAQLLLDATKPGLLHSIARAELYTARNSPKAAGQALAELVALAPELPHAAQLARLAKSRGIEDLPPLPAEQKLVWVGGAPVRARLKSVKSDAAAAELAVAMRPHIKADDGAAAEALLDTRDGDLTPEARAEWAQRVAWIYYTAGDDANARRMAARARRGEGDWVAQADWVDGLAAWRQQDCGAAQAAFQSVAQRATHSEMRSAGLYWASRADIACGHPELVQARLQSASQYGETFYGLLARHALGMDDAPVRTADAMTADWHALGALINVQVASALIEIDETALADRVLRHQAKIGDVRDFAALSRLAGTLNLPQTQLWLAQYCPPGASPAVEARYPAPNWTPDGGWRVDKALVYAHALQESRFDADIVSPAGAFGLMQIMPAAATDIARARGVTIDRSALARPSTNIEVGQSYLEKLRDMAATQGLLPKVIAAYNAGPSPVEAWNVQTHDNGDPLLYIESIPYWETRGYVMTVLRNYWMYERKEGKASASRAALAQGLWPKFPGLPGEKAVRISKTRGTRAGSATGAR